MNPLQVDISSSLTLHGDLQQSVHKLKLLNDLHFSRNTTLHVSEPCHKTEAFVNGDFMPSKLNRLSAGRFVNSQSAAVKGAWSACRWLSLACAWLAVSCQRVAWSRYNYLTCCVACMMPFVWQHAQLQEHKSQVFAV